MRKISVLYRDHFPQIRQFFRSTSGATAVEYALLVGLIALGVGGGLTALADLVVGIFDLIVRETSDVATTVASG